jgi:hypothetical protein
MDGITGVATDSALDPLTVQPPPPREEKPVEPSPEPPPEEPDKGRNVDTYA